MCLYYSSIIFSFSLYYSAFMAFFIIHEECIWSTGKHVPLHIRVSNEISTYMKIRTHYNLIEKDYSVVRTQLDVYVDGKNNSTLIAKS